MSESVKIIEHGLVVTCDAQNHFGYFALLLKDDRITELNPSSEGLKARYPNAEVIDAAEKIIFPGFIDAHYHGESFVLRNWTSDVPLSKWSKYPPVRKALSFVRSHASKEELIPMYRTAYFSALKSGITTLSEFGFDNTDIPFLAAREAMKRSDLKGFVGIHNGEQAELARNITPSAIAHALILPAEDELTVYNLQTTLRTAHELKWPIISHLGESRRGLETVRRNFHRSIVSVLEEYKVLLQPVHLAHLALLDEGEESVLMRMRIPIIINPVSVLAKDAELPPLARFLAAEVPLALCSDWGTPDPFENMRGTAMLAKRCGAEPLSPMQIIGMHTIHAARALHMHHHVGSVESGKKADLAFLDISDLRLSLPLAHGSANTVLRRILQEASSARVSDVMINGEFFIRKGQVMTYAEEDLKREYREVVEAIVKKMGPQPEESPAHAEVRVETPIIPLHGQRPMEPLAPLGSENESFEEGFRIIGKTGSLPPSGDDSREVDRQDQTGNEDIPKTVRKIFGDDDF